MSAKRYTLDTYILFYAVDAENVQKHSTSKATLRAAYGSECVITLQCMSELYNAVSRKKPQHLVATIELIHLLNSTLTVVRSSAADSIRCDEGTAIQACLLLGRDALGYC